MRFSRRSSSTVLRGLALAVVSTLAAVVILAAGTASAQEMTEIRGLLSASGVYAIQMGELGDGSDTDDSAGIDVAVGFKLGDHFAFQLGYDWQKSSDFDTHYFPAIFRGYAKDLGLDLKDYDWCLTDPKINERVTQNVIEGRALRVRSTPTFFIAGERLAGSRQLSSRGGKIIEAELKKRAP